MFIFEMFNHKPDTSSTKPWLTQLQELVSEYDIKLDTADIKNKMFIAAKNGNTRLDYAVTRDKLALDKWCVKLDEWFTTHPECRVPYSKTGNGVCFNWRFVAR